MKEFLSSFLQCIWTKNSTYEVKYYDVESVNQVYIMYVLDHRIYRALYLQLDKQNKTKTIA